MSDWSYCYKRHHVHVYSSLSDLPHVSYLKVLEWYVQMSITDRVHVCSEIF